MAEKLGRQARAAEIRIDRMDLLEKRRDTRHLAASLSPSRRGGRIVFEVLGAAKGFEERTRFRDVDLSISYGERIRIAGANGAGKTTLLRMLQGRESPDAGAIRRGSSVDICYLAQEQKQLEPNASALETIEAAAGLLVTEARTLLACFLFREWEVFQRVRDLSGGERARLAAAAAAASGANVPILDEPTNHLDIAPASGRRKLWSRTRARSWLSPMIASSWTASATVEFILPTGGFERRF